MSQQTDNGTALIVGVAILAFWISHKLATWLPACPGNVDITKWVTFIHKPVIVNVITFAGILVSMPFLERYFRRQRMLFELRRKQEDADWLRKKMKNPTAGNHDNTDTLFR